MLETLAWNRYNRLGPLCVLRASKFGVVANVRQTRGVHARSTLMERTRRAMLVWMPRWACRARTREADEDLGRADIDLKGVLGASARCSQNVTRYMYCVLFHSHANHKSRELTLHARVDGKLSCLNK